MFAICIPRAVLHRFKNYGMPHEEIRDGWIGRTKERPDGWYLASSLVNSHRWGSVGKAESAALLIATVLPDYAGKMVIVEVARVGRIGWRRV